MNEIVNYEDKKVLQTIRETVAIGATDSEFAMFIGFCKATGLNPFKREIWFIKVNGRVQMMTGINGFHAIANSHPEYDGIESGLVGKGGEYLSATYPGNDFIGAWARVHRKDRKLPIEGVAMLSEYDKGHGNWKTMRRVMINKCAESVGLRKGFPQQLGGLYTDAEYQPEAKPIEESAVVVEPLKPVEPTFYLIEAPTKEQTLFMSKRGEYVQELGAWCVKKELEPREIEKLAPYKTTLEEIEATKAQAAAVAAQVEPVGETQKVEREETPLEKAKKRVTKMLEGTDHEVI
jgi:phage recombination protein Bet